MRYFGIVLAFLMAATATLLFGTSASADASGIQFMGQRYAGADGKHAWYSVDFTDVCKAQYPGYSQAGTLRMSDAASVRCWRAVSATSSSSTTTSGGGTAGISMAGPSASITGSIAKASNSSVFYQDIGGLDIQKWCTVKHPRTHSTSRNGKADGWVCMK